MIANLAFLTVKEVRNKQNNCIKDFKNKEVVILYILNKEIWLIL